MVILENNLLFGLILISLPAALTVAYMLWAMDDTGLRFTLKPGQRAREKRERKLFGEVQRKDNPEGKS